MKLSLTSNGYTIDESSDETLGAFREVEVSIDFPTERLRTSSAAAGTGDE